MCFELTKNFRTSNNLLKIFNEKLNAKYGIKTKTYSDIITNVIYEEISLGKIEKSKNKYNISVNDEEICTFKTKKDQKEYINAMLVDKIKNINSNNIAILVSKRSDLNFFKKMMEDLNLPESNSNLVDTNEFKMAYYIIKSLLKVEKDDLIRIPLKGLGYTPEQILIKDEELLNADISKAEYKNFLKHHLEILALNEDAINELLDIVVDQFNFFNFSNKTLKDKLFNTICFIERIFNSKISIQSSIKQRGNIKVLTKHSSKGLEFDTVINIVNENSRISPPIVEYSDAGLISNYYSINKQGMFIERESKNYKLIKEIEKIDSIEQKNNLEYVSMTRAKNNYIEVRI